MICAYCGKIFDRGNTRRKYCCDECSHEANKQSKRRRESELKLLRNANARQTENKLNKIMKECAEQGISYSEWKKAQTLAKVPRIEL